MNMENKLKIISELRKLEKDFNNEIPDWKMVEFVQQQFKEHAIRFGTSLMRSDFLELVDGNWRSIKTDEIRTIEELYNEFLKQEGK